MISQHYTASDLNTPYERAREKLAQEYCLYVRSKYLRDSYDAAVATIELTWADFAGPHIPTSLQHNLEAATTSRYVRGVVEIVQRTLCEGCRRPTTILGNTWEHLTVPQAQQVYGPHATQLYKPRRPRPLI